MREAARGNLDHGVAVGDRGRGELSELTRSFNEMTGRIREMIRAQPVFGVVVGDDGHKG